MRVPRLLCISPPEPVAAAAWVARAPELVAAGADGLLLRVIADSAPRVTGWTKALGQTGATVVVHARTPGAAGMRGPRHLPASGPPGSAPFGRSCHDAAALSRAAAEGAYWATLSPIFRPRSKPGDDRPTLGLEGLAAACASPPLPVLALGGITADTAPDCVAAGAWGVAGIDAFGDPASVADIAAGIRRASR